MNQLFFLFVLQHRKHIGHFQTIFHIIASFFIIFPDILRMYRLLNLAIKSLLSYLNKKERSGGCARLLISVSQQKLNAKMKKGQNPTMKFSHKKRYDPDEYIAAQKSAFSKRTNIIVSALFALLIFLVFFRFFWY